MRRAGVGLIARATLALGSACCGDGGGCPGDHRADVESGVRASASQAEPARSGSGGAGERSITRKGDRGFDDTCGVGKGEGHHHDAEARLV